MPNNVIDPVSNIISGLWTWIVSGWVGGWLMNLYQWSQTWSFKVWVFLVSIWVWAFAWYVAWEFTGSWAISWISWAMSMKIFEVMSKNWEDILNRFIESKIWVEDSNSNDK